MSGTLLGWQGKASRSTASCKGRTPSPRDEPRISSLTIPTALNFLKAALSSGSKSRPAIAPAENGRSNYEGAEIAEAFGMRVTNW